MSSVVYSVVSKGWWTWHIQGGDVHDDDPLHIYMFWLHIWAPIWPNYSCILSVVNLHNQSIVIQLHILYNVFLSTGMHVRPLSHSSHIRLQIREYIWIPCVIPHMMACSHDLFVRVHHHLVFYKGLYYNGNLAYVMTIMLFFIID